MSLSVLATSEVIAILFAEVILILFSLFVAFNSLRIYRNWDFSSLSEAQNELEKKTYFTTTFIYFILFIKFFLFLFFANTIDKLSNIVPGAMCGAGVIGANEFGILIFVVKLIFLFLAICWIVINKIDLVSDYNFIKQKYLLFFVLFGLLVIDFVLQTLFFSNISLSNAVHCCSVIYGVSDGGSQIPFGLSNLLFGIVFAIVFFVFNLSLISKNIWLSFIFGVLFLYFGYYFSLHILGTYIYELPTHICPFCMLQKEYFFVGYLVWGVLFFGGFFAMTPNILNILIGKYSQTSFKISILFNFIYAIICVWFILGYYIKNGVWL